MGVCNQPFHRPSKSLKPKSLYFKFGMFESHALARHAPLRTVHRREGGGKTNADPHKELAHRPRPRRPPRNASGFKRKLVNRCSKESKVSIYRTIYEISRQIIATTGARRTTSVCIRECEIVSVWSRFSRNCSLPASQKSTHPTTAMHTSLPRWVLCHEYRRSKRRCVTVREMKVGPSGSAIRC
jgi:hypothetical protein